MVNLAVRGRVMMTQQRFDAVLQPGDFAVYDSALPCRIACPDPFRQSVLKIPRDMYTAHCLLPGGGTAAMVRGDHGVGALFAPLVRYLYLLFQAEGTSPARWILERRLEQASRLLADSRQADWTITDIAFSVGFKDASHFTRAFKNTHGCCPREYRRTASGYAGLDPACGS